MDETNPRLVKLIDRLDDRLAAMELTDRKASLMATGKVDAVRNIRRGSVPSVTVLNELAATLKCDTDYLLGNSDIVSQCEGLTITNSQPNLASFVTDRGSLPSDIPVFGTALGADVEYWTDSQVSMAIEQTDLNTGEVIDHFRRPAKLRERRDIYGLYVAGTSMEPAFEANTGILVDPRRAPSIRDYVVVYLKAGAEDGAAGALIKRLVKRTSDAIELEQFNPPAIFRIEKAKIGAIHRVIPWHEAMGA